MLLSEVLGRPVGFVGELATQAAAEVAGSGAIEDLDRR